MIQQNGFQFVFCNRGTLVGFLTQFMMVGTQIVYKLQLYTRFQLTVTETVE